MQSSTERHACCPVHDELINGAPGDLHALILLDCNQLTLICWRPCLTNAGTCARRCTVLVRMDSMQARQVLCCKPATTHFDDGSSDGITLHRVFLLHWRACGCKACMHVDLCFCPCPCAGTSSGSKLAQQQLQQLVRCLSWHQPAQVRNVASSAEQAAAVLNQTSQQALSPCCAL